MSDLEFKEFFSYSFSRRYLTNRIHIKTAYEDYEGLLGARFAYEERLLRGHAYEEGHFGRYAVAAESYAGNFFKDAGL